jgi:hypothetical protein
VAYGEQTTDASIVPSDQTVNNGPLIVWDRIPARLCVVG